MAKHNRWADATTPLAEQLEPRLLLSAVLSDDFYSLALNDAWTFVDPVGDSTLVLDGTNALITVPAGGAHGMWATAMAPRLMQSIDDTDFQVEVKFETRPLGQFSVEGIVVEQDGRNFLRFDLHSTGPDTMAIFASSVVDGVPKSRFSAQVVPAATMYMRVTRQANHWTQQYSYNGTTWLGGASYDLAMDVAMVGPFIGNESLSAPEFTGSIDYFFNTASPIIPEDAPPDTTAPQVLDVTVKPMGSFLDVDFHTNEPASAIVQYGRTTAYEMGSAASPAGTDHAVRLGGLTPETTYHFRVIATDASGNSTVSADMTADTSAASAIRSDAFYASQIDESIWEVVDTIGDCVWTMSGTNVIIDIPAGVQHTIWNELTAPRLMQSAPDEDFEVEVKFDSLPKGVWAVNGIFVEGENGEFIRFDYYSTSDNPTTFSMFASSFLGGSHTIHYNQSVPAGVPLWMRVKRQGDHWTESYSYNGAVWYTAASFDLAIAVRKVGPWVGNEGDNPPAYTASIDYFFNTASPILPEDGVPGDTTAPQITNVAVAAGTTHLDVTFATDEPTGAVVRYGLTTAYELGSVSSPAGTSHEVRLNGLSPGHTYHFRITATDASGNSTVSADLTAATATSLAIRSDDFHGTQLDTSIWQWIDPVGDSSLTMDGTHAIIGVPAGAQHPIWTTLSAPRLMQQAPDEDFEVEVKFDTGPLGKWAANGILVQGDSQDYIRFDYFSSTSGTAAVYSMFAATFRDSVPTIRLNKHVTAAAPMWMRVKREGNHWTQSYSYNGTVWTVAASFDYNLAVTRIGPYVSNEGASPPAYAGSIDYFFNTAAPIDPEDGSPAADTTSPQIANILLTPGSSFIDVSFTTDEPAAVAVAYGMTTAYEMGAATGPTGTTHTVRLTGLTAQTTYQLCIEATDAAGNLAQSPNLAAATAAPLALAFQSDDFRGTRLNAALWTFVNPKDDATLTADGTNILIAVPAGSNHDVWTAGNLAPRIMQPAANQDFEIEVKFDSEPTGANTFQGVIVQADAGNYLRFDIYSNSATNRCVFAAAFVNGSPAVKTNALIATNGVSPKYLRITRAGNNWTYKYSYDGQTWTQAVSFTQALAVTQVGAFVGNAVSNPAFTGSIDYFFNTAAPIDPEDGPTPPQTPGQDGALPPGLAVVVPSVRQVQADRDPEAAHPTPLAKRGQSDADRPAKPAKPEKASKPDKAAKREAALNVETLLETLLEPVDLLALSPPLHKR